MELREDQTDVRTYLCSLLFFVALLSVCKSGFCQILIRKGGVHSACSSHQKYELGLYVLDVVTSLRNMDLFRSV